MEEWLFILCNMLINNDDLLFSVDQHIFPDFFLDKLKKTQIWNVNVNSKIHMGYEGITIIAEKNCVMRVFNLIAMLLPSYFYKIPRKHFHFY